MKHKPNIQKLFGDSPVLDILHIANQDYVQGRLTSVAKLLTLMYNEYPQYDKAYLKRLINITIHSEWFGKTNSNQKAEVHLIERGVEVYLQMLAGRQAQAANRKANIIIGLTVLTIVLMFAELLFGK